jgi:hypothetical protein
MASVDLSARDGALVMAREPEIIVDLARSCA